MEGTLLFSLIIDLFWNHVYQYCKFGCGGAEDQATLEFEESNQDDPQEPIVVVAGEFANPLGDPEALMM